MLLGIELPFVASFLYPALNQLWWHKIQSLEAEIQEVSEPMDGIIVCEFFDNQKAPIYIFVNNSVIPISGKTYKDRRFLLSKFISEKQRLENYWLIDADFKNQFVNKFYLNTIDDLNKTFDRYSIDERAYAIKLPLEVYQYKYTTGFHWHKTGYIGQNKQELLKVLKWEKRLPGTLAIPIIGGSILALYWLHYLAIEYDSTNYPPFHYKRLTKLGRL